MIKGRLTEPQSFCLETNVTDVLRLAKQSYENYLIRSSEQDLESAVDYYIEAISIDPSISEAYYRLASLLWEKGRIDINSALMQCQKAISLDPNSSIARLYLGYFLKTAGRNEEAENEFLSSIKLSGLFSSKPRIALGLTLIQNLNPYDNNLKQMTKGFYYFLSGIMLTCVDCYSLSLLSKSVLQDFMLFCYKTGGKALKKLKNYDAAVKLYETAAEKTGKSDLFFSEIAELSLQNGNPYNAVKYYQSAIQNSPQNKILWTKLTSVLEMYYQTNIDEILECYHQLSRLEPTNARFYYELGHLYIKIDNNFNALNSFKKACELEKTNPYYHNSLAYVLVQLEDYEGAIEEYQKAIKLSTDKEWSSIVSQALGAIYFQIKNNVEASILAYQTAVLMDPLNVEAYVSLGESYQSISNYTNAIECFCEAVKIEPSNSSIYAKLGLVLWEQDFAEEAIIAYQKAVDLNKNFEAAYNNLGAVYLDGTGDSEKALESFNKALNCNPNYALAYYNIGRCYQIYKNKTKAAEAYQMAIDINKITDELDTEELENKLYSLFSVQ